MGLNVIVQYANEEKLSIKWIYSDKQNQVQNLKCQLSRAITKISMIVLYIWKLHGTIQTVLYTCAKLHIKLITKHPSIKSNQQPCLVLIIVQRKSSNFNI